MWKRKILIVSFLMVIIVCGCSKEEKRVITDSVNTCWEMDQKTVFCFIEEGAFIAYYDGEKYRATYQTYDVYEHRHYKPLEGTYVWDYDSTYITNYIVKEKGDSYILWTTYYDLGTKQIVTQEYPLSDITYEDLVFVEDEFITISVLGNKIDAPISNTRRSLAHLMNDMKLDINDEHGNSLMSAGYAFKYQKPYYIFMKNDEYIDRLEYMVKYNLENYHREFYEQKLCYRTDKGQIDNYFYNFIDIDVENIEVDFCSKILNEDNIKDIEDDIKDESIFSRIVLENYVGRNYLEVKDILMNKGFDVKVEFVNNDNDKDTVVSQSLKYGIYYYDLINEKLNIVLKVSS